MTFPARTFDESHTVVFTRNDGSEPRVTDMPIARIVASVIDALSYEGDDAELMMVRRDQSASSRTIMAVANLAWMDTNGEFVFSGENRDRDAMEAIHSAPRSWALVAMTQALCSSRTIRDAASWYHALLASEVETRSTIMGGSDVSYRFPGGETVDQSYRYDRLYLDICTRLEREGRSTY